MRYYSTSEYYKKTFGSKVYRLSIDAGCTCPTRDGSKDTRGCIFCSPLGSGDFTASRKLSIPEQIEKAKQIVSRKTKNVTSYLAYFQNFTNTYGNEEVLKEKYKEALSCKDIKGLIIATRPDCISETILAFLAELSRTAYISIELGLQTSNNKTAEYIRRNFSLKEYTEAVHRIHKASQEIHIVTHIIFGLPGENKEDMIQSVKTAIQAGTDGLKFTVLYILKGTDIEIDYKKGMFRCLEENDYFSILADCLRITPPQIVIHRLTGDGPKRILTAPLWTTNKKQVLNDMNNFFEEKKVVQGEFLKNKENS